MSNIVDCCNDEVLEGYICPMCMSSLGTPDELLKHFEKKHSSHNDYLKSFQVDISNIFGKAKKKILSLDEWSPDGSSAEPKKKYDVNFYKEFWPSQELGACRNHSEFFKKARDDRYERFSHEINKLIIRLDKLLTKMPTDPVRKKSHEQSIVPWLDGKDVPRCPNCTKSFNIAKRQHHCRLCGSIMCHDCSLFLPLHKAKQILVDPDIETVPETFNTELKLRVCSYCLQLLESREMLKENRNIRPPICELYDTFIKTRKEATKLCDMYSEMVNSLLAGETTYHVEDARALRLKLGRIAEQMDAVSNKIGSLAVSSSNNVNQSNSSVMSISERLQKSIKMAAKGFILTKILSLPNVPSEDMLKELQEQREREERERRRKEEEELKQRENNVNVKTYHNSSSSSSSSFNSSAKSDNVEFLEAWSPANTKAVVTASDPLVQQISNIKNYIKEARLEHRYDAVASLEKNLKELQEEYFRRQNHDVES